MHRAFPWSKVPPYAIAQIAGAFAGAAIVFATYREAFSAFDGGMRAVEGATATAGIFATYPQPFLSILDGDLHTRFIGPFEALLRKLGVRIHVNQNVERLRSGADIVQQQMLDERPVGVIAKRDVDSFQGVPEGATRCGEVPSHAFPLPALTRKHEHEFRRGA